MHELILIARTGKTRDLASKLGISERSVYNYISFMKTEMKAPIIYDVHKGNYRYNRNCELCFWG